MHNSPRIRFAFCVIAAHEGQNLFCHRVRTSPLHMRKEQTDHDGTALPFYKGSGPTADTIPDYTPSIKQKNLAELTYIL